MLDRVKIPHFLIFANCSNIVTGDKWGTRRRTTMIQLYIKSISHFDWSTCSATNKEFPKFEINIVKVEVKRRRGCRLGHINRMALNAIPGVSMRWTPAGKRKRGRPKLTWSRSVEKEMREVGWTWSQVQRWAPDRKHFSSLVTALCATSTKRNK